MPKLSRTERTNKKPRFLSVFRVRLIFQGEKIRKRAAACGNGNESKLLVTWRRAEWQCVFSNSPRESQKMLPLCSPQEPKTVGHLAIGPTVGLRWPP